MSLAGLHPEYYLKYYFYTKKLTYFDIKTRVWMNFNLRMRHDLKLIIKEIVSVAS
jgi:hypothetical protein